MCMVELVLTTHTDAFNKKKEKRMPKFLKIIFTVE